MMPQDYMVGMACIILCLFFAVAVVVSWSQDDEKGVFGFRFGDSLRRDGDDSGGDHQLDATDDQS